jgi:hypothetical protein
MNKAVVPKGSTALLFDSLCQFILFSVDNMTSIAKRHEKNGFLLGKSVPRDGQITLLKITGKERQAPEKHIKIKLTLRNT